MMFFYGLPGVLPRMVAEAGLELVAEEAVDPRMRFRTAEEAVEASVLGGPLAGLFAHRLDDASRAEVREEMLEHLRAVAAPDAGGVSLPAAIATVVARRPA